MSNAIYVSINKDATNKIVNKIKNHEFRNYIPKKDFDTLYVYVTAPISKLLYIINIERIITYPETIQEEGDGNNLFNEGNKSKYAYKIGAVYKLNHEYTLSELKENYEFTPPQSYAYADRYKSLSKKIEEDKKELVWKR